MSYSLFNSQNLSKPVDLNYYLEKCSNEVSKMKDQISKQGILSSRLYKNENHNSERRNQELDRQLLKELISGNKRSDYKKKLEKIKINSISEIKILNTEDNNNIEMNLLSKRIKDNYLIDSKTNTKLITPIVSPDKSVSNYENNVVNTVNLKSKLKIPKIDLSKLNPGYNHISKSKLSNRKLNNNISSRRDSISISRINSNNISCDKSIENNIIEINKLTEPKELNITSSKNLNQMSRGNIRVSTDILQENKKSTDKKSFNNSPFKMKFQRYYKNKLILDNKKPKRLSEINNLICSLPKIIQRSEVINKSIMDRFNKT